MRSIPPGSSHVCGVQRPPPSSYGGVRYWWQVQSCSFDRHYATVRCVRKSLRLTSFEVWGSHNKDQRFLSFGIWRQSENYPLLPSPGCSRYKSLVCPPPGGNSFLLWNYVTSQKTAFRPFTSCFASCPNSLTVLSFFDPIEQPWLISNLMHKILIYLQIIHLLKSFTCFVTLCRWLSCAPVLS